MCEDEKSALHFLDVVQFGWIGHFRRKKRLKRPYIVSRQLLVLRRWFSPQSNCKTHISISVWYKLYPLEFQKWLKLPFLTKKDLKGPNIISREPLVLRWWFPPNSNCKTQFCISIWFKQYPSDHQKWLKKISVFC